MEEANDSTLKLGATTSVDGRGREGLPDDAFVNLGGDEKRDTGSQAVTLLEELVEKDDNQSHDNVLQNQEKTDTGTEVAGLAVQTRQDIQKPVQERVVANTS